MPDLIQQEIVNTEKQPGLQIRGVNTVFEKLAQNRQLPEVLDALCLTIEKVSDEILCTILLVDKKNSRLIHGAAPSFPKFYRKAVVGIPIQMGMGSCGEAAFTARRVIVEDILIHPNWKNFTSIAVDKAGLRACWSEPIFGSDSKVLGTFAIYYRQPKSPGKGDIELIRGAAHIASIAIEYSRNRDKLKQTTVELEKRVIKRTDELRLEIAEKEKIEKALRVEINERKLAEQEREKLIFDLRKALSEVKQLSGLLPICSFCKKIRDDKGYWNQIETYISEKSDAQFSHGICQKCAEKHYPDLEIYDD